MEQDWLGQYERDKQDYQSMCVECGQNHCGLRHGEWLRLTVGTLVHKPGCLWTNEPNSAHRVPIDCVTADMLWEKHNNLKLRITELEANLVELKARLFDEMEKNNRASERT